MELCGGKGDVVGEYRRDVLHLRRSRCQGWGTLLFPIGGGSIDWGRLREGGGGRKGRPGRG